MANRISIVGAIVLASLTTLASAAAQSPRPSAAQRMQDPGPEARSLQARTGMWDVIMRLRPTPDAQPVVTTGLIAERKMVGLFLEEVMRPAPGTGVPDFRRIAYQTYSRVEGRWQYVSLDTRLPVGIMPAWSFGKERNGMLALQFEPLGFVGMGEQVEGRLMRSNLVLTPDGPDHEFARQYWITADGTEREWLAVEYEYKRNVKVGK